MKTYKLEDWHLFSIELTENEQKKFSTKYKKMKDPNWDFCIYDFDEKNIINVVKRLMQKKGFYDDYNKKTIIIIAIACILNIFVLRFGYNTFNQTVINLQEKVIEQKKEKETLKQESKKSEQEKQNNLIDNKK